MDCSAEIPLILAAEESKICGILKLGIRLEAQQQVHKLEYSMETRQVFCREKTQSNC